MRKLLIVLAVAMVVPLVTIAITFAVALSGTAPIVDGQRLGSVGQVVSDGYVSLALLDAGNGQVVLIDCGNTPTGVAILAALAARHLGPEAVSDIFLTHGHPDHLGGCHLFPKAQLHALAAEVPLVEGRAGSHGPLPRFFPIQLTGLQVADPLTDGERVTLGNLAIETFAVPGHTHGSAAYLVGGVLFLGDSADRSSEGQLSGAKWLFSDDQAQDRAALRQLAERLSPRAGNIQTLAFSHSGALDGFDSLRRFGR